MGSNPQDPIKSVGAHKDMVLFETKFTGLFSSEPSCSGTSCNLFELRQAKDQNGP